MGSCSCKSDQKSQKNLPLTVALRPKHKIHQQTIIRLRQGLEIRRFIFQTKDLNAPTLNITKSQLYNRRREILPLSS